MKIKAIILANESPNDHRLWEIACQEYASEIDYRVVDLTSNDWLENIQKSSFDILLARPGGLTSTFKQLYDERIFILSYALNYMLFPTASEIFIYENKRFLSFWLQANQIPHPQTSVFYQKKEAVSFLEGRQFPIVGKTSIGASGRGVSLIKNRKDALEYINQSFSQRGAPQRTGPNFEKNGLMVRVMRLAMHPVRTMRKLVIYRTRRSNPQIGYVIFQEYIPHEFEWRVVRIGDSFFAHKKLKAGDKASGSLLKEYGNPPLPLLDFAREITDRFGFNSQALDIFESDRGYLVNEMQCIFGQSDSHQMLVKNKPGRYLWNKSRWDFQEGDFNRNESFNLRVQFVIEKCGRVKYPAVGD